MDALNCYDSLAGMPKNKLGTGVSAGPVYIVRSVVSIKSLRLFVDYQTKLAKVDDPQSLLHGFAYSKYKKQKNQ